ncbi:ribosome biogenesis protein NOP53 isoform X1 [Bombyx mori]|uniref:Ribosome biogenesis protein NOP53 n=1 Tax=Bombyx mori TaxID=7091 RepID=A0A8R2LWB1_BOMMO|nr:ribosome biogenesis protein NOP53 isoform X1 [Bombyx mori]
MTETKKKKHVSKKNKKAWRKHCDIKDVENFLEDQRLEERLGKFETKPDSEIFIIDTGGDGIKTEDEDIKPISLKKLRRSKLGEFPKCFEILLPDSKVQDPNTKRNTVKPVGSKPTAFSKLTDKRKYEKGIYQKKIEDARRNRKMALQKKRRAKQVRQNFNLDLWGKDLPDSKTIPSTLCDEFIPPQAQLHNVLPEQRLRQKPPLAQTLVTRAAVDVPHPGVSYNPSYQEHQELLQEVVQHEQKLIKKEQHLDRVTTKMFKKVTAAEKENQWREEMSEGLPKPHNPAEHDSESDGEYKAINPPVKNKKKDHKARRKQKERLLEKERLKREKIDKKKITDIYKLRKLESSIKKGERVREAQRAQRAARRAARARAAPPALSAHPAPAPAPPLVAPAQLSGDLRRVAPAVNLLRERFESLQHRGALAASKVMMKKKRKLKSYFKPGHKVTDQDVQKFIKNHNIEV